MEKQIINVEGMFCGYCEVTIQDAVRKLPGIKKVKASRRKKQTLVEYDSSEVTLDEIKEAIKGTGYDVV